MSHSNEPRAEMCQCIRWFEGPKRSIVFILAELMPSKPSEMSESLLVPTPNKTSKPLVHVYHRGRGRSVLQGIPATFGRPVSTQFEGHALLVSPSLGCNEIAAPYSIIRRAYLHLFAVIERGECKFIEKVKQAQDAGFEGAEENKVFKFIAFET